MIRKESIYFTHRTEKYRTDETKLMFLLTKQFILLALFFEY
jgi:hypothetical protein